MLFDFIQNQILGMHWLHTLTGEFLQFLAIDIQNTLGASLHFFLYDFIKISILLLVLIYGITYLQSFIPETKAKQLLGKNNSLWTYILSALFGTITPFCSCSSIPLFIAFIRANIPLGVTFSFLISSPMVDLASLFLLTSIFNAKIALLYVFFGLIIAILGGIFIDNLSLKNQIIVPTFQTLTPTLLIPRITSKMRHEKAKHESLKMYKKLWKYIALGVAIGAFIHNVVPQDYILPFLGNDNPFNVILAVLIGTPIYADIFGTIPIAEALLAKGASLGTVLALMMSVTTLSLPSIIMLGTVIKKKLLCIFISICVLGIIISGYLFNLMQ